MKKLSSFSNIEPKTLGKRQNFTLRSINCILRDQRSFIGNFSCALSNFFIYFGLLAKTIRSVCQNCFRWALRIVLKKRFSSKNYFACFSYLDQTFLGLLAKKLVGWQNCRWKSPGEHFENKVFFEKKILFFSDFETKAFGKRQKFSTAFSELHKTWPKKHLKELFSEVWGPILSLSDFYQKQFRAFVKTAFNEPWGSFWKRKNISQTSRFYPWLLDLQPTILGFWVKKSRVVCQNYILCFQRIVILKKNSFWKNR